MSGNVSDIGRWRTGGIFRGPGGIRLPVRKPGIPPIGPREYQRALERNRRQWDRLRNKTLSRSAARAAVSRSIATGLLKLGTRALPGVGLVFAAYEVYDLWKRFDRPKASLGAGWDASGWETVCSSGGGAILTGSIYSCGQGSLHHVSTQDVPFLSGGYYNLQAGPDIKWSLDSNYYDWRPDKIVAHFRYPQAQPQPPLPGYQETRADPRHWADPGPAVDPFPTFPPWVPAPWPRDLPPGLAPDIPVPQPLRRGTGIPSRSDPGPEVETEPALEPPHHPGRTGPMEPVIEPTITLEPGKPTRLSRKPHERKPPGRRTIEKKGYGSLPWQFYVALSVITEAIDTLYCLYDALPAKYRKSRYANDRALLQHKWTNATRRDRIVKGKTKTQFIKRPPPQEAWARIRDYWRTQDFYLAPTEHHFQAGVVDAKKGEVRLHGRDYFLERFAVCVLENFFEDLAIGLLSRQAAKQVLRANKKLGISDKLSNTTPIGRFALHLLPRL